MGKPSAVGLHVRNGFCSHEVHMRMRAVWSVVHAAQASQRIWQDILSGEAERSPTLLARFLVLSYADLKRFRYYYW